jgi:phosphate:Na+ symporter
MNMHSIGLLLGGIGLFLLGMNLMTQGLKAAAGPTLGRILQASTQTAWRGLLSGILITALVQSSSAVTVAAIGFINAGVLGFGQSLWVIFGANVGTTMTGWLVAALGFKISIEAAALPMIGVGMALRLSSPRERRGALGDALAGFGILFLGLGFLQQAFASAPSNVNLAEWAGEGPTSIVLMMLSGLVLTAVMQSSSAAMAIVLTLSQSGLLPLSDAAAAVIGTNVGTTVTALLATIGATPNAKRAAVAHVLFNVLTGGVALLMLPILLGTVEALSRWTELDASPAMSLALFHTLFNVMGVLLMWPLAGRLAQALQRRFRTREEDIAQPLFLDRNVATVPALAINAMRQEITRLGGLVIGSAAAQLLAHRDQRPALQAPEAVEQLSHAIAQFASQVSRGAMSQPTVDAMAQLLQVLRYYDLCNELQAEMAAAGSARNEIQHPASHQAVADLLALSGELMMQLNPDTEPFSPLSDAQMQGFEQCYHHAKNELLHAGVNVHLDVQRMDQLLRSLSTLRRVMEHASKAAVRLNTVSSTTSSGSAGQVQ